MLAYRTPLNVQRAQRVQEKLRTEASKRYGDDELRVLLLAAAEWLGVAVEHDVMEMLLGPAPPAAPAAPAPDARDRRRVR